MKQLLLFDKVILKKDFLVAPLSPRQVVYNIWLIRETGKFVVKKESGCSFKKQTACEWIFDTLIKAERFYDKKVDEKMSLDRKKRIYIKTEQ